MSNAARISVRDAARLLDNRPPMWVMQGLRLGSLPIGCAVLGPGGRYSYDVRPERLAAYMGVTMDELQGRLEEMNREGDRMRYAQKVRGGKEA